MKGKFIRVCIFVHENAVKMGGIVLYRLYEKYILIPQRYLSFLLFKKYIEEITSLFEENYVASSLRGVISNSSP